MLLLLLLAILALAALALVPHYLPDFYVTFLSSIFRYMVLTVSWATFCGPTGYISLSSAAFLGVGMYVTALLGEIIPLPVVVLLGGVAASLLALLAGLATLRIKGIFFAMFTLGLSEGLKDFINWWEMVQAGRQGRLVISASNETIFYVLLTILALTLLTSVLIRRSKYGLALRAIGQEEEATDHLGVNVNAVKLVTFVVTSFWIGTTGAITVTQFSYVDTQVAFSAFYSFVPTVMALFGGLGNMLGWVLGSFVFTILTELLLTPFPYFYMLIFGTVIISVFLFFPSGLVGLVMRWRKRTEERPDGTL